MTTLTFTPASSPALAKRFPKASVVSTVADFDEIGPARTLNLDAGFLHLERITGVTPEIAKRFTRPFDNLLSFEAGFTHDRPDPSFSAAVAKMGILDLTRLTGVSLAVDALYPKRPGSIF